jgi:predicted nucleic acid-binding protein
MKDKYFIDTNIFIYSFDSSNLFKQQQAKNLISNALYNFNGCISYQVIQEFINVATQKFDVPLNKNDCKKYIASVLEPLCEIFSSIELFNAALDIKEGWKYSFYDSLIIAAALKANCKILFSEDMQHEQKIHDLVITNPFIPEP